MNDSSLTPAGGASCPVPRADYPHILLAHGGGGRLMHRLIDELIAPALGGSADTTHDAAILSTAMANRIAFTTDSFVVRPLEFPGGDIGRLAVFGTINDLAMSAAAPMALSLALIIEEGFPTARLTGILHSIAAAAKEAGVRVVTGDTKVIDRRSREAEPDLFITTSGVGVVPDNLPVRPGPAAIQPGDRVLINGDIARHGMAVMAARADLGFESTIESDCAPLHHAVHALLASGVRIHAMRDLTRGGLAAGLHELARARGLRMQLHEPAITVRDDVRAACELTGIDPLFVANEGRFVCIVPPDHAAAALASLRQSFPGLAVADIGEVLDGDGDTAGPVPLVLRTAFGTERLLDLPAGDQLPRIC
ncbi:MAG: hydrogenase expression/formation protein HypE [Planctomycetota bacterium]